MGEDAKDEANIGPRSWITKWHWEERILKFEPSWFLAAMGTGTVMQDYVNFPYPITGARAWLRDIGYCLWILDIVLVFLFSATIIVRYIWHPALLRKNLLEFPQSSYLGAIPISFNTVIIGIISFYDYRTSARWAAFACWWVTLALTLSVSVGLICIQTIWANEQDFSDVAGLWVMTTVPLFTTAAAGATMLPYLVVESNKCAVAVLVVSFMCWAFGLAMLFLILPLYLFRLLAHKLPGTALLPSGFLPCAALSIAAYAAQSMSIFLASQIRSGFVPQQGQPPPLPVATLDAVAETVHWMGILLSLALLAHATFWLVQATVSLLSSFPKQFNISLWSTVFPLAAYTNSWAYLGRDLRNDGMRGWTATCTVLVTLLWLFCALETTYLGFWKGSLFSAPGLEEWLAEDERKDERKKSQREGREDRDNGTYALSPPQTRDEEKANEGGNSHMNGNGNDMRGRRRTRGGGGGDSGN